MSKQKNTISKPSPNWPSKKPGKPSGPNRDNNSQKPKK